MTSLAFHEPLFLQNMPAVAPRDLVSVPGDRIGEVLGFYRNDDDLVLVRLDDGESRRYARADIRVLTT